LFRGERNSLRSNASTMSRSSRVNLSSLAILPATEPGRCRARAGASGSAFGDAAVGVVYSPAHVFFANGSAGFWF